MDLKVDCEFWAGNNECSKNADYMEKYCPRACKLCDAVATTQTTPPKFRPSTVSTTVGIISEFKHLTAYIFM